MSLIRLATLLMQRCKWNQLELSRHIGIYETSLGRYLKYVPHRTYSVFKQGVVRLAYTHGLRSEVMDVVLDGSGVEITTALRAVFIYPDLRPNELTELLMVEKETQMSPLPATGIEYVVQSLRRNKPQE